MKFINPCVKKDLDEGKAIGLDLGSGGPCRYRLYSVDNMKLYSVDHQELDGVDVVADLNKPLSLFPDSSIDYIYSRHVLEHVDELLPLMCEIHRIIKPDGKIEIVVPHFSNVYGYSDPTHVRFFGLYSMYYFASSQNQPKSRQLPSYYTDVRFRIKSVKIEFYRNGIIDKLFSKLFYKFINKNLFLQDFYERRLSSLFHAHQLRYIMQAEK